MQQYTLNNGMNIDAIGFGCYNKTGGDNYQMFCDAIKAGYRLFDTASIYCTERDLGRAIKDSGLDRSEFFIQSKCWIDEMGYNEAKAAVERSLERLQMDYIDIFLIHWPRQLPEFKAVPGHPEITVPEPEYETNANWKQLEVDTYRALEEMVDAGKIKAIGLSNFLPHHLSNILNNCRIKPVVDQLEIHLGHTQASAVSFAMEHGVRVEAWSPLGRGNILEDPFYKSMAAKYNVTVGQLGLRFLVQMGIIPLPKSITPSRQVENLNIFDFEISEEDYYILLCMAPNSWTGEHPDFLIPKRASKKDQ